MTLAARIARATDGFRIPQVSVGQPQGGFISAEVASQDINVVLSPDLQAGIQSSDIHATVAESLSATVQSNVLVAVIASGIVAEVD